jgi:hypothetical protein
MSQYATGSRVLIDLQIYLKTISLLDDPAPESSAHGDAAEVDIDGEKPGICRS